MKRSILDLCVAKSSPTCTSLALTGEGVKVNSSEYVRSFSSVDSTTLNLQPGNAQWGHGVCLGRETGIPLELLLQAFCCLQ